MVKQMIALTLLAASLSACSIVYKSEIQQGRIISHQQVAALRTGMSESKVTQILGEPLLRNIVDNRTVNYVYTMQPSRRAAYGRRLILSFDNHKLVHYHYDSRPIRIGQR